MHSTATRRFNWQNNYGPSDWWLLLDPVVHALRRLHAGTQYDDGAAGGGKVVEQPGEGRLAAQIKPGGGLGDHADPGPAVEFPRQDQFLDRSPGER